MRLSIANTWDGNAIAEREVAHVDARLDGDDLVVLVDAPYGSSTPPPGPPGPVWKLWEHEVVELFVAGPSDRYLEIELGPHGHHLVLQLDGRRNIVRREIPITFTARIVGARWMGEARVPQVLLPERPHRANAYRHDAGRFYAAAPVGPKLDFHQLDRFVPVDVSA